MATIGRTVLQMLALSAVALVLGLTANAGRESGSLMWTKNYFDRGGPAAKPLTTADVPLESIKPAAGDTIPPANHGGAAKRAGALPAHSFQTASFDVAVAIFESPDTADGLNVFIDARPASEFADGHIPGAIRCFPFEIEKCIDEVLQYTQAAYKVVVYCNGGDCEDSIFMCRELLEAGLAHDQIFLYEGGWKEWSEKNQPSQRGTK